MEDTMLKQNVLKLNETYEALMALIDAVARGDAAPNDVEPRVWRLLEDLLGIPADA